METDSTERADAPAELTADPFAVDLFAASRAAEEAAVVEAAPAARAEAARGADSSPSSSDAPAWHARLPKVTREEARFSAALARLPPPLSPGAREILGDVLGRYTRAAPADVLIETVDAREVNLAEWAARTCTDAASPCLFVTLSFEPQAAHAYIAADAVFVSALVRRMLTDEAAPPDALRPLSKTEQAVAEFLGLTLVHELNAAAGEPLLKLERVSNERPPRLTPAVARESEGGASEGRGARGMLLTVRVAVPSALGLVRVLLEADALEALDARRNPLLAAARRRGAGGTAAGAFARFVRDVPLRLLVGETSAGAHELAGLEPGDVLLVERPLVDWRGDALEGAAVALVGAGGVRLSGVAETLEADARTRGATGRVLLRLDAVTAEDAAGDGAGRFGMREEEMLAEPEDDGAGMLENLMLTVHVELAARRITLDELARLRAGQILELGCRADDPVDLVADGRRIATGELVDVEGRLGVRVTQLAG